MSVVAPLPTSKPRTFSSRMYDGLRSKPSRTVRTCRKLRARASNGPNLSPAGALRTDPPPAPRRTARRPVSVFEMLPRPAPPHLAGHVPMRVYGWHGGDMSITSGSSRSKNATGSASMLRCPSFA